MPMMIPQNFIDDLLARIDIVDIIGARIHLRKMGGNFTAPCPFHNEKTPSFTVSPSKQFYYCFGCRAHGDAIAFLMKFENLEFVDAVETLAAHLGIEIPKDAAAKNNSKSESYKNFYAALERVSQQYSQQLNNSKKAQDYLKRRGLSKEICLTFGLGYADDSFDNLRACCASNQDKENLIATGMLLQKDSRVFARFRNRLMFPIRERRGRIIGFGGRTLGEDLAKYLNSPETVLFHKGNELYGLYEARKVGKELKFLIVVEGYMDVIALVQHGVTNVVATLGTAITSKQVQQLLRHTSGIVFCFDGDNAGKGAAWRALENILPMMHDGIRVKFLFLPETEDPDSLIRKEGKKGFASRMAQAVSLEDFFYARLKQNIDLSGADGRAMLAQKAKGYLERIPKGVFQQLLWEKLASIVRMDVNLLRQDQEDMPSAATGVHNSQDSWQHGSYNHDSVSVTLDGFSAGMTPVQKAISLLLQAPILAQEAFDMEKISQLPGVEIGLFVDLINLLKTQQNFTIGAILEYYRETKFGELLTKLAVWEPVIPKEGLKNEFIGTLAMLSKQYAEKSIQALLKKSSVSGLSLEEKILLQKLISHIRM
jgi:DNA primase